MRMARRVPLAALCSCCILSCNSHELAWDERHLAPLWCRRRCVRGRRFRPAPPAQQSAEFSSPTPLPLSSLSHSLACIVRCFVACSRMRSRCCLCVLFCALLRPSLATPPPVSPLPHPYPLRHSQSLALATLTAASLLYGLFRNGALHLDGSSKKHAAAESRSAAASPARAPLRTSARYDSLRLLPLTGLRVASSAALTARVDLHARGCCFASVVASLCCTRTGAPRRLPPRPSPLPARRPRRLVRRL
jgi:hypothetical protein